MELWEYVEVLLRWGWVIVLVAALCTAAALGFATLQTPRYTSIVEIDVTPARLDLGLSQTVVNLLRNYVSSIKSESMARRVIDHLSLSNIDATSLQEQIDAEARESEFTIKIEVTDRDPVFAQRLAQATAELFVGDVQAFAQRQDPRDRLTATMLNDGAQAAGRTWPRDKLLAFAGVGGGLALGLVIGLALEWAHVDVVESPQEVEEWLGLPVVGSIPAVEQSGRSRWTRGGRKDRTSAGTGEFAACS
ncbi:MAG TPA: Wzz/FepE/Etk N-terminal domain-containing protein [Anaerolineae bacterium]|nr:Wzz/FepE/Etk N-terminal domain-containing protein [Anaerolineae bacterium]